MNNLPPLTPLISFWAAAEHGSFTRAAQELNVTHGAVSRAVKQLEEYFGFELFERRNRGIYLTERGRIFAGQVGDTLGELEKACERLRSADQSSRLSVSCEPTLAMRWLMPRLDAFHRSNPGVDVQLSTAGGPIDLSEQGVHLAIRRSDFTWPKQYWHMSLGKESIGPVCSPGYWEAHGGGPVRMLHTRTRPEAWTDWKDLSRQEVDMESEQFFDHFYFSLQAATAGLGMAIGPEPLVQDDMEQGMLMAPYGFEKTPSEYVVLCRTKPEESMHKAFITWLATTLALPQG